MERIYFVIDSNRDMAAVQRASMAIFSSLADGSSLQSKLDWTCSNTIWRVTVGSTKSCSHTRFAIACLFSSGLVIALFVASATWSPPFNSDDSCFYANEQRIRLRTLSDGESRKREEGVNEANDRNDEGVVWITENACRMTRMNRRRRRSFWNVHSFREDTIELARSKKESSLFWNSFNTIISIMLFSFCPIVIPFFQNGMCAMLLISCFNEILFFSISSLERRGGRLLRSNRDAVMLDASPGVKGIS